jgi:hypothetical protein
MPLQDNLSMSIVVAKAEDLERAINLTFTTMMQQANDGDIVAQLSLLVEEAQQYMEGSGLDRLQLPDFTSMFDESLCCLEYC